MKKLFIFSSIFLGITILFLIVYSIAFKKSNIDNKNIENETSSTENSAIKQNDPKKIIAISDIKIIGPIVDKNKERIIYYSKEDGTVWESGLDGSQKKKIENISLSGLVSIAWEPNAKKSISEFVNEGKRSFYEFDHSVGQGISLNPGTDYVIWDSRGEKIIYKFYDSSTKKRSLNISSPDGTNQIVLAEIPYLKVSIQEIPHTALISYWNYPNANEESILKTVGVLGGDSATVFSGKYGADYLWSPSGERALVSSLDSKGGKKISLGTLELKNKKYQDFEVPTFTGKSVWSNDNKTIYFALPLSIPENALIPDDYLMNKIKTNDNFWKLDIMTGKKERIIAPENIQGQYDASNLFLSPSEDALFFVNKIDDKLYKIEL